MGGFRARRQGDLAAVGDAGWIAHLNHADWAL